MKKSQTAKTSQTNTTNTPEPDPIFAKRPKNSTPTETSNTPIVTKRAKSSATNTPTSATPTQHPDTPAPAKRSRAPIIIAAIIITLILAATAIVITLIIVNNQPQNSGTDNSQTTQTKDDTTSKKDATSKKDTTKSKEDLRDEVREQSLQYFKKALTNYQTNNRGALPAIPDSDETVSLIGFLAKDGLFTQGNNSPAASGWGKFYYNYLTNKGEEAFADPKQDSTNDAYNLQVVNCDASSNDTCSTQPKDDFGEQDFTILVVVGAKCKDDVAVKYSDSSNATRHATIMYTGETDLTICQDV